MVGVHYMYGQRHRQPSNDKTGISSNYSASTGACSSSPRLRPRLLRRLRFFFFLAPRRRDLTGTISTTTPRSNGADPGSAPSPLSSMPAASPWSRLAVAVAAAAPAELPPSLAPLPWPGDGARGVDDPPIAFAGDRRGERPWRRGVECMDCVDRSDRVDVGVSMWRENLLMMRRLRPTPFRLRRRAVAGDAGDAGVEALTGAGDEDTSRGAECPPAAASAGCTRRGCPVLPPRPLLPALPATGPDDARGEPPERAAAVPATGEAAARGLPGKAAEAGLKAVVGDAPAGNDGGAPFWARRLGDIAGGGAAAVAATGAAAVVGTTAAGTALLPAPLPALLAWRGGAPAPASPSAGGRVDSASSSVMELAPLADAGLGVNDAPSMGLLCWNVPLSPSPPSTEEATEPTKSVYTSPGWRCVATGAPR